KVTASVTTVAQYPKVRRLVKKKLRELAKEKNLIVAGRDIGTNVFPKADIKIFLNPSIDARARRRYKDHVKEGRTTSYGDLKVSLAKRDEDDSSRKEGPLKKPKDALEIDNTYLLPSQTLKIVIDYAYKEEPEIKDLKDEIKELKTTPLSSATATNNNFSDPFLFSAPMTTSVESTNKKESMKELKKRLKAKYKSQTGGGSFWQKR
ncbi:MAG: (d)CMP kinase, partial [Patescibacteria group bacterium]